MKIILQLVGVAPDEPRDVRLEMASTEGKTLRDVQTVLWYARRTSKLVAGLPYQADNFIIRFFGTNVLITSDTIAEVREVFGKAFKQI